MVAAAQHHLKLDQPHLMMVRTTHCMIVITHAKEREREREI